MSLYGQKGTSAGEMGAFTVDSEVFHLYGTQETVITRPSDTTTQRYDTLVLMSETGTWRFKPGDQKAREIDAAATDADTNTFTVASHGYEDQAGPFVLVEDNTLPTGLAAGDLVYIIYVDANSFQLSTIPGGDAIDISDVGTSTNKLTGMTVATAKPTAADANGTGCVPLGEGISFTMQAPTSLTVKSYTATSVLTYWWA